MIGVISKAGQEQAVEEFFELFKTPWEWHSSGRSYDVVLATADEVPDVHPKLLIICGTAGKRMDAEIGLSARGRQQNGILRDQDSDLPIYGDLLTFSGPGRGVACVTGEAGIAAVKIESPNSTVIRLGYDLFAQVQFLLSTGQSTNYAHIPTLDIHIRMLRAWILEAGIPLLEIPPVPEGHDFSVCLTHDIDFVGIRRHRFDHTMFGFIYRATVGAVRNFLRGRLSAAQLVKSWRAVASLPFVYAGWAKDFWEPFEWYLEVEKGIPATYFLIPFKRRAGENTPGARASLRAAAYDITDLPQWTETLQKQGCELGVHGIDAWHSVEKGRAELGRIKAITGSSNNGIRMHWLLHDHKTPSVLEQAGFEYDSTSGYNEAIGYRGGTGQVFQPAGARILLELPMHIQDGALFYPQKLDLSQAEAETRCQTLIDNAIKFGGVLTILWHDRSHGPERFWGEFYVHLVRKLKGAEPWFATAGQMVGWFRKRRQIRFARSASNSNVPRLNYDGDEITPRVKVRMYQPVLRNELPNSAGSRQTPQFTEVFWNGKSKLEQESNPESSATALQPDLRLCSLS